MIKNIAILTSGGDAPGMNAAIRSVVYAALNNNIKPYIVYGGYKGLVQGNIKPITKQKVKQFNNQGGTFIHSARFPEFKELAIRQKAIAQMKTYNINALVAIGGDGTYMGAAKLTEMGIHTVGIPGTIDNDISSTDFTIGFDTALETIVEAIDKIRETSESHDRVHVIETMGRYCGDLALNAAIATSVEVLSIPEAKLSEAEIIKQVKEARLSGHRSVIVLVTEYLYDVKSLAEKITKTLDMETRFTVLGHIQRGGKPSAAERVLAARMGAYAVKVLLAGESGVAININGNNLNTKKILDVIKMKRPSKDK